jgi:hypothetical protein
MKTLARTRTEKWWTKPLTFNNLQNISKTFQRKNSPSKKEFNQHSTTVNDLH